MLKERDWRRRNRDRDEEKKKKKEFWWENGNDSRTKEESTFYTSTTKDGIIKQEKPEKPDIPTIKDNIEAAEKKVNQLKNEQFDLMAAGGRDDQIYTAKKNVENAQKEVENFNLQLTEAYGLGLNGYWNNKNPMNEEDRTVHEAGQKPTAAVQPATTPTVKPKSITRPKTVTELDGWVNNPEGYRPLTATATKPKATTPVTPRKRVTRVPTTHLDMDIAQMQDELVNNPNMSDYRKGQLQEKLNTLTAEKNVLTWKSAHRDKPTIEDFETQQRYYEREIQKVQDDMVNGLGNGSLKVGSGDWYALHNKADNLEQQIKAYNRGMMGVLDGEKAVSRSEQTATGATRTGGGQMDDMSLSANNDAPMYAGLDGEEQQSVFDFDNTISEEERLRQEIEVTFASLQNMSDKEQTEFMMSGEGKKYQQNLNELRNLIGFLKYTDYTKELYGEGIDNTQSYSSVEYLDSIKDDRGHVNPNNIVNTVKDKVDYLKEQISGFYIEAKNMSSVELEEKYPNGIGDITAMEFELQDLIGNKEYQEFMSLLLPEQR